MTTSQKDRDAKEAALWKLWDSYPNFKPTDAFIDSVLAAVEPYSPRAVASSVKRFLNDEVAGHESRYVPNAAQIAGQAKLFDSLYAREVIALHSGILEVDYGHGRIDLRGLTIEEQVEIMRHHGVINGCNLALMSLEGKKAALAGDETKKIEGFKPPAMKRMTD